MPWLYYARGANTVIFGSTLDLEVTFAETSSGVSNRLSYFLARYDIEGNYYGLEGLSD